MVDLDEACWLAYHFGNQLDVVASLIRLAFTLVSENYDPTSYYRSWAYYLSFKDTPIDLIVRETLTGTMPVHRFFTISTFFCMLLVMVLKSIYGGTEV